MLMWSLGPLLMPGDVQQQKLEKELFVTIWLAVTSCARLLGFGPHRSFEGLVIDVESCRASASNITG